MLLSAFLLSGVAILPVLVTAGLLAGGGLAFCATDLARRASSSRPAAAPSPQVWSFAGAAGAFVAAAIAVSGRRAI